MFIRLLYKCGCLLCLVNSRITSATFHKRNDALEAIEKAGHTVEFLPPYSPDLNPIEKKWALFLYFNL